MRRWTLYTDESGDFADANRPVSVTGLLVQSDMAGLDPDDLLVESYLNGERRQSSRTSQFIFKVDFLVSFISQVMTLYPGDLIITGTPAGIGPMKRGDEIEVRIEGIGSLRNTVK